MSLPKYNISNFLIVLLVFLAGCGKDRDEQIVAADKKLLEAESMMLKSDFTNAEILLREAADLNRELQRDSVIGDIALLLARFHRWHGKYDSIPVEIGNAVQHYRKVGHRKGARKGTIDLVRFYMDYGDYESSISTAAEVIASAKILQDTTDQLEALFLSAKSALQMNQYALAQTYAHEITNIVSPGYETPYGEYVSELLTDIFIPSGMSGKVLQIIRTLDEEKKYRSLLRVYARWGELLYMNGKLDSAVRLFSQAMIHIDKQTDGYIKIKLLTYLGLKSYISKRYENARMYFLDAISVAKEIGDRSIGSVLDAFLIACDWKYSDPMLRRYLEDFLDRDSILISECKSNSLPYGEMISLALRARLIEEGKDTANVSFLYEEIDSLRRSLFIVNRDAELEEEILRVFLDGEFYAINTGLLKSHVFEGRHGDVFKIIEGANINDIGRFFSNLTISTRNDAENNAITLYQQEYRTASLLWGDIIRETRKGKNADRERINNLKELFAEKAAGLKMVALDISRIDRNMGLIFYGEPPPLEMIRDSLLGTEALVEYFNIRDTLYFMVVRNDTSYIVKGSNSRIKTRALVGEYNRLLGNSRLASDQGRGQTLASVFRINELSQLLGNELIAPLDDFLRGVDHIYIVPPPEYGMLPFHTLQVDGIFLSEKYTVHYLPVASALLMSYRAKNEIVQVTVVGHPGSTNWDVEYELRDIRSFFDDARMIFNKDATLPAIENVGSDVIHLGAEFRLDVDYPDNTTCVLSNGKSQYGTESVKIGKLLIVPSPQVFLLNNIAPDKGVLSRYIPLMFLANGTPAVITTMWPGDRKSKRAFGEGFYTALKKGEHVSEAFNIAIKYLTGQQEFSKPYKWGLYYYFGKR